MNEEVSNDEAKNSGGVAELSPRPAQGKVMYVAGIKWDRARLASFVVKSETSKTVTRDKATGIVSLVGRTAYLPERLSRASYSLFETRDAAILYLSERVMDYMARLQTRVNDLNSDKVQLRNLRLNAPERDAETVNAG